MIKVGIHSSKERGSAPQYNEDEGVHYHCNRAACAIATIGCECQSILHVMHVTLSMFMCNLCSVHILHTTPTIIMQHHKQRVCVHSHNTSQAGNTGTQTGPLTSGSSVGGWLSGPEW